MTVKVVGQEPGVERETVCRGCGAKLRYVPNDVQEVWEANGEGGQERRRYLDCPSCQKQVTLRDAYVRLY